eukprot:2271102-Rhodomonas_salina.2
MPGTDEAYGATSVNQEHHCTASCPEPHYQGILPVLCVCPELHYHGIPPVLFFVLSGACVCTGQRGQEIPDPMFPPSRSPPAWFPKGRISLICRSVAAKSIEITVQFVPEMQCFAINFAVDGMRGAVCCRGVHGVHSLYCRRVHGLYCRRVPGVH